MNPDYATVKAEADTSLTVDGESKPRLHCDFQPLTLAEACSLLRISKPTMHALLARHAIPAKRIGRCWRFDKQAIISWFQGNSAWRASRGKR